MIGKRLIQNQTKSHLAIFFLINIFLIEVIIGKQHAKQKRNIDFYGNESLPDIIRGRRNTDSESDGDGIPKYFNAATDEKFKECHHFLNKIPDQSWCNSCYAVQSAAVLTDRLCIAQVKHKLKHYTDPNFSFSSAFIMACAEVEGQEKGSRNARSTFEWIEKNRIVSGGDYSTRNTKEGYCWPFPFPPRSEVLFHEQNWPDCPDLDNQCENKEYPFTYNEDKVRLDGKYKAKNNYRNKEWWAKNSEDMKDGYMREIQWTILDEGPVVATIDSYPELKENDGKTIFECPPAAADGSNAPQNKHDLRIVGWGETEDKVKYWIAGNTLGEGWGDKGFFKILRGANTCGLETYGFAWMQFFNPMDEGEENPNFQVPPALDEIPKKKQ